MKEAAGEANMTVITIVLIGIVLAAGGVIIDSLLKNVDDTSDSLQHGCGSNQHWNGTTCVDNSVK